MAKIDKAATQALSVADKRRRRYITASVLNKNIRFQYDTGSDITIIGRDEWIRLGSPKLLQGEIVEYAGGSELDVLGRFCCPVSALGRAGKIDIDVAARNQINLFGLNAIDNLHLWSTPLSDVHDTNSVFKLQLKNTNNSDVTNQDPSMLLEPISQLSRNNQDTPSTRNNFAEAIHQEFPNLFADKLGTCHNFKAKFTLTQNAQCVQMPCRQIPIAMEKLVQEELQRLESLGIIERVESSDWTSPIVIARKHNGKIRLCADFSTRVNRALIHNRHPLPCVESIMTKLNGSHFFSLLDLSDAFFQVEIAERHKDITTISTPIGLFRFKRLPFGIKTAPAIFQQAMDHTLSGLDGVYAYIDDVVITGSNRAEHDRRLR